MFAAPPQNCADIGHAQPIGDVTRAICQRIFRSFDSVDIERLETERPRQVAAQAVSWIDQGIAARA